MMNIYVLEQAEFDIYSVYESCVVIAESEESAMSDTRHKYMGFEHNPNEIKVTKIGTTEEKTPRLVLTTPNQG